MPENTLGLAKRKAKEDRNPKSPPCRLSRLPKAASESSPLTLPSRRPSARSSDGVVLAQGCQKRASTNHNRGKHTPMQSKPRPKKTRTCICAPPAGQIDARCNAGHSASRVTENGACDAKAARDRAKKVGRGGTTKHKPGKETCHVNNYRQDSRQLERCLFHPSLPCLLRAFQRAMSYVKLTGKQN